MHKTQKNSPRAGGVVRPVKVPKKRHNRKRRNWHKIIRRTCGVVFLAELAFLLFANPRLCVTKVRIDGLQTLAAGQVFSEAQVPNHANIFLTALSEPFAARLRRDPVIDHVRRSIELPHTLVLTVTERQPFATLAVANADGAQDYWLLDRKRVPYRVFDAPPAGVPLLEWEGAPPAGLTPGKSLADARLAEAYGVMALVRDKKNLDVQKIKVDQNANLCLNSTADLQIKLGQPDALPQKVALAQAALDWQGGDFARRAACIDVSCPQQPVYTLRTNSQDEDVSQDSQRSRRTHGH